MAPILHDWLCEHHGIRDSIIWETTQGVQLYKDWPQARIDDLQAAFAAAWNFSSIQLNDPPPNVLHPGNNSAPTTALSRADAHSLYLASIGQSLAVEIDHRVGWSVANFSSDNLAILFDSREFFVWSAADNGYEIQDPKGGYVVPASPHTMHRFLKDNDLIGTDRHGTIVRVIKWCHHKLNHYNGGYTTKTYHDVWQYRGEAPVLRTLEGTTDQAYAYFGVRHWTAGCHGTAGFLRAILRTVNIPVVHDHQCGHALPYFSADGLHLSHGDDPYDGYTFADPPYSMSELLLDQTKFDSWFGSGVSEDAKCKHIGKRVQELAIQYVPTEMLRDYCNDQALGKSHADGAVAANMPAYTVAQLEAHHLWSRMDAKIASMGGCDHVPY
jgi:hypothetical protein